VARFTFFVGKGGAGKTTISSAYALYRAANSPRERILLLSTDPAHSLADVLQTRLSDSAKKLKTAGQLWARQLDADRQIRSFLARERGDILSLLSKGSLFTADELEPLLDTSLPGMSEVAALLAIHELLESRFDEVVIDTAPMGHAIRLFQMPEHFARFLDVLETAASRDVVLAQHFGGRVGRAPALDRWAEMVEEVEQALSASASKLVLVTTPEPFSLNEAARSAAAFQSGGAKNPIAEIVLNRVVTKRSRCPRCNARAEQTIAARKFLQRHFGKAKVLSADDPGAPILGIPALTALGAHIFGGKKLSPSTVISGPVKLRNAGFVSRSGDRRLVSGHDFSRAAKAAGSALSRLQPATQVSKPGALPSLEPAQWPRLDTPLTLTLGKGGVGKTTISAALAFHHRRSAKNDAVTVCSVDPAPSLDDIFQAAIGSEPRPVLRDRKLHAVELDAMADFRQWTESLRERLNQAFTGEQRGLHIDVSLDRRFLLALLDIVPPGVDEIFAIFRILELLAGGGRVVIDMAPTGHALELLRTPDRLLAWARLLLKTLAQHRELPFAQDAAVEVASVSQNVRALAAILRDPNRSQVMAVTLPEPLPDYETRRLLHALEELETPLRAVFINRVLTDASRCARCRLTMQWQNASLAGLRKQLQGVTIFVAPEQQHPVAGELALKDFTQEILRIE
jgi:arsenite/tail-anchored protein-transporting ATPase